MMGLENKELKEVDEFILEKKIHMNDVGLILQIYCCQITEANDLFSAASEEGTESDEHKLGRYISDEQ